VSRPFQGGTITPAAEFTIYIAPEAADIVFKSGVPLVVMPLDVTHKALTSREWVEEMRASGTPDGQAVASWTDVFERFDTAKYGSRSPPARPLRDRLPLGARPLHRPPHQR
jgi:purine nucleosidase